MTLPEIIKKVQHFKDKTWEIRVSNPEIAEIEWVILNVSIDVIKQAAKFYVEELLEDEYQRKLIRVTPQGSFCSIYIVAKL